MFLTISVVIISLVICWYLYRVLRNVKVPNLSDKFVLITGCDSGFGRKLARRLDMLGLNVLAGCLTEEGARDLVSNCSSRLTTLLVDVTSTDSVQAALELVQQRLPGDTGLWALVNNAGILGNLSSFELCTKEDLQKVLDVNLLGVFQVTRTFLPLIRKSKGRVVNISSMCGRIPLYGIPYCVSKFGLEALSDLLRRDVHDQDIRVCLLEPGGFQTPIVCQNRVKQELLLSLNRASPSIRQVYADYVSGWENTMLKLAHVEPNLEPVIQAYEHAVTARYPRTRYVVGREARFLFVPMSFLPTRITDAILRLGFRLILSYSE